VAAHPKTLLKNDTLLRALARQPTEYTPVWLMRQAGRYLPEYNATRARAGSFLALAKTPSLATEVTLQPLERFPLDAAILFSDILTIPDAMGLGLEFAEGEGPRFARPLRDEVAIRRLATPDLNQLKYVFDAVREIRGVHTATGMKPADSSHKITTRQLAEHLRLQPSTIRAWARLGRIPSIRANARVLRFDLHEVLAALAVARRDSRGN